MGISNTTSKLLPHLPEDPYLKWLLLIAWSLISELSPIWPVLATVLWLIVVDLWLGTWASFKLNQPFTSGRLRASFNKACVYMIILITLFFTQKYVWFEWISAVKITATGICAAEVLSILENSSVIVGKPVFKFIISKLGSLSKKDEREKQNDGNTEH